MSLRRGSHRWGIVGFGWVARDYMAPGILAAGGRVAAIFDPDPAACEAARALDAEPHGDIAGLIAAGLDAVYVATPNHLHRAAVEACLQAGVPVLCEKPLAATFGDAEAMIAAAERAGVPLAIAFDQRHHPAHRAMRDAIVAGRIGTVTAIRIVYGCWLGPDWVPDPARPQPNWRIEAAKAGGGAVIDLAPHGLDLVDALLGERVVELHALLQRRVQPYPVDDGGALIGRTGSGVLVSLHNSYNTPDALPRRRLEVIGTLGQITAEDTMGQTAGGRVTLAGAAGISRPLPFDADENPFAAMAAAFARGERIDPRGGLADLMLLLHALAQGAPKPAARIEA